MGGHDKSFCNNTALQNVFSLIGAVEKAGSGADTILRGWNETNFGTPIICEKSEPNKVELVLPIEAQGNGGSNGGSRKGN